MPKIDAWFSLANCDLHANGLLKFLYQALISMIIRFAVPMQNIRNFPINYFRHTPMKNTFLLVLVLLWSSSAIAKVINVEFKFTPFIGDPATADHVQTVSGKARVFLNNVPVAEQELDSHKEPVLFDEREVGPAVWVPVGWQGTAVRKGKNTLKVEFEPSDSKTGYSARLSWAEVTDEVADVSWANPDGNYRSGEGQETKEAHGKIALEKDFIADFAADLPWHHYPPVTALSDADKLQLLKLVNGRAALFQPKFDGVIEKFMEIPPGIEFDLAEIRRLDCLGKAYAAGVRIAAHSASDVDFVLSGNQEVFIKGKTGSLYPMFDEHAFAKRIEDDEMHKILPNEMQWCAMTMVLFLATVYPPQLVVVKTAAGAWEVVY
jgi:hypothetical protein